LHILTGRSKALQGLSLLKYKPKWKSKEELEIWVKKEYNRHYKKGVNK